MAIAAVPVWLLARHLDARPGRVVIDKQSGQEITLRGAHDFFFIPLKVWPAILVIVGTIMLFV
jgi:hypothetical protein